MYVRHLTPFILPVHRQEVSWILERLPPGTASLLPDSLCAKLMATLRIMEETYRKYR